MKKLLVVMVVVLMMASFALATAQEETIPVNVRVLAHSTFTIDSGASFDFTFENGDVTSKTDTVNFSFELNFSTNLEFEFVFNTGNADAYDFRDGGATYDLSVTINDNVQSLTVNEDTNFKDSVPIVPGSYNAVLSLTINLDTDWWDLTSNQGKEEKQGDIVITLVGYPS